MRWHLNTGRLDRKNMLLPACGDRRFRNLHPLLSWTNCKRCRAIAKKTKFTDLSGFSLTG